MHRCRCCGSVLRDTRLIVPLRTEPVTIPPAPFQPPPRDRDLRPTICAESASAKPRFLLGLDKISDKGRQKREQIESARAAAAKDHALVAPGGQQWKLCARRQSYFAATMAKNTPADLPPHRISLPEKDRDLVVSRLSRVPPPRPPLPPLVPKLILSDEDEAAMVERLTEPFEKKEHPPPERRILDDEELDEHVNRMYYEALARKQELHEKRMAELEASTPGRKKRAKSEPAENE
jgi:hypothetical protein